MPYLFSGSLNAFFHTDVPDPSTPGDAVEVSDTEHDEIMTKVLREGMTMRADANGLPAAATADDIKTDQA